MKPLKHLSAPGLINNVREVFQASLIMHDGRMKGKTSFSLVDVALSAVAMFQLKSPSMLQFDKEAHDDGSPIQANLKTLYRLDTVPSDTQMRTLLDKVHPKNLRCAFTKIFSLLQSSKMLSQFVFYQNKFLFAMDGTGYFSSSTIHCNSCCVKKHQNGSVTYYHQALAGVFIHPNQKAVIPCCPEPIIVQDGASKNDCERNASERLLKDLRREHPHLDIIVTEDSLSSNGPHIKTLKALNFSFILGAKPGDHVSLYEHLSTRQDDGLLNSRYSKEEKGLHYQYSWANKVPLNATHPDCIINFLELIVTNLVTGKQTVFSWVTDLTLDKSSVEIIAKGGRARWKIENETFNTLKNQNYEFEHNFGHGAENLSVNLMILMFLAFLMDQVLQLACPLFQAALVAAGRKAYLWRKMRSYFESYLFKNWEDFYHAIIKLKPQYAILDTS